MRPKASGRRQAVERPESPTMPVAEGDAHRRETECYAIEVLEDRYASDRDRDVYVSGRNVINFTEGVREDSVSPDTYVVKGVPRRVRPAFNVWEEGGKVPCFVLEITSKSTRREDLGDKLTKYRDDLGVREYFLFDPMGEWIDEKLRGYRLEQGADRRAIAPLPSGRLGSEELGLELAVRGGHIRFFEPGAAEPLATRLERAERAEAEVARLRAEVERLRRKLKR